MVHPEPIGTDHDLDADELEPHGLERELDELTALRDANRASGDRAARATRSASAYLDARRRRLKRELRDAN